MQGQLFTQDFLRKGVLDTPPWQNFDETSLDRFIAALKDIYGELDSASSINEAQTEQLVIERVLTQLGWGKDYLPQVNLSGKRREDVPDILLFADEESLRKAIAETKDDRRYRHGIALLEAKRWMRELDRGDDKEAAFDPGAPSSQMLRYLSRADVASDRKVKWGMLTNGAVWRLYWQDARSRAEEFLEINVAALLGIKGFQLELDDYEPRHGLKLFFLLFHRQAFLLQSWQPAEDQTFHAYALNEARLYEEKVSQDLGSRVFNEIFPNLAHALAQGDVERRTVATGVGSTKRQIPAPEYLHEVREAALVLLYRLLFLFYAEDRGLLPVRDPRYKPYSLRSIREDVRDKIEASEVFSSRIDNLWRQLQGTFLLIDEGDDAVGMPAYNGGLFDRSRAPLLERARVPDAVMAPLIDALSRRQDLLKAWINYRDLSVSHLGGIYERLLEYALVVDTENGDRVIAQPASFARKVSGSYYTHEDLVRLILKESVGLLIDEKLQAFDALNDKWSTKLSLNPAEWETLDRLDAASHILELKICDPAMGSGHFLVSLVDYLADRVLEAMNSAEHRVAAQKWAAHLAEKGRLWESPLVSRIADIRRSIKAQAKQHGWAVTDAQLDDRHIVRRMILKKTIFGVDKNIMAVELAKTALWLHTFTVGAPLSFLDHHLRCGDSLHGERFDAVAKGLSNLGLLFQQTELKGLERAAQALVEVADLTDIDIAQAKLSKQLAREAGDNIAPLHALLDFWRAMRWLLPGWPIASMAKMDKLTKLGDEPTRAALMELLDGSRNLAATLHTGSLSGAGKGVQAANDLIARVRELSAQEHFFHWWTEFPNVWKPNGEGGFDAVIGNPPWDMLQMQEVEWFSERVRDIAQQSKASERKRLIALLPKKNPDVWAAFVAASERADQEQRVVRTCGDYPLLSEGRSNLYKLFVERAQALLNPQGIAGLLTPSGIAADKGAAEFFKTISTTGRLGALYDFENKKVFFADVHASFKFCVLVFGAEQRRFAQSRCAFYLHSTDDALNLEQVLALTAQDFIAVNPNTGAAPIFRNRRDADITLQLYREHPVLVRHGGKSGSLGALPDKRAWPVKYVQGTFNMTSDSHLFLKREELVKRGYQPAPLNHWVNVQGEEAVPLYVGRMISHYDHRASSVTVNEENLQHATLSDAITLEEKTDFNTFPSPQYWVAQNSIPEFSRYKYSLGFRSIARPTDVRTMIVSVIPESATGNSFPLLRPTDDDSIDATRLALLQANLSSFAFDFCVRQKVQGSNINWYIVEQLPVISPECFEQSLGGIKITDFIREQVLHLSYTAHDLASFARDLGYVNADGTVKPPFVWNEADRRARMAALDALFFHLYGINEDDAAYIMDTFPIVREQDMKAYGRYRTKDEVIAKLREIEGGLLKL